MQNDFTILVVDDDPVIRSILNDVLSPQYRLLMAQNGEEALQVLDQEGSNTSLILSDMEMPRMGGLDLLVEVRKNYPDVGMIMISGTTDVKQSIEAMRGGAYDFVTKPFTDVGQLELLIQRWRYQQSLEAKLEQYAELHREMMKNMKIRTFMAIDVVDSKKLKKNEDPFLVQFSFSAYQKLIAQCVMASKGIIHNTSGDGTMACFVSAAEAFKAGGRIFADLADFNNSTNRLTEAFEIRMGLHTGPVVLEQSGEISDMFAESLDIAGHIQKHAAPNSMDLSAPCRESVVSTVEFETLDDMVDGYLIYRVQK